MNNISISRDIVAAARLIISDKLKTKTLREEEGVGSRKQERAKKKYVEEVGPWLQNLTGPDSDAREIAENVKEEIPGRNTGKVAKSRKREWVKRAKQNSEIMEFAEYIGGPDRMYDSALYIVRDVALGFIKLSDGKKKAEKMADKWYEEKVVDAAQEQFEEAGYDPSFLDFLPSNISFELGPTGEVQRIAEKFGREKKTWETTAQKMAFIAEHFNEMVREVKDDMKSSDEVTRLCALMAAVIMETGLRPGSVDNKSTIKDPDTGEEIEIETFGVSTMQKQHVKFVRKNYAKVEYTGKAGGDIVGELSDSEIVEALQDAIDGASPDGSGADMLFVTKSGEHVDDGTLRDYMSAKWGDVTPRDFRKLKATEKFYEKIRERSAEMQEIKREAVASGKDKLRERVVNKIMDVLESAAEEARDALSHDDYQTTVESYIDPRVVVNFLNKGGLEDALTDILTENKNVELSFDCEDFINQAKKTAGSVLEFNDEGQAGESLKEVIDETEDFVDNLT